MTAARALRWLALVAGAAYFKTHRDRIAAWGAALRDRLRGWE